MKKIVYGNHEKLKKFETVHERRVLFVFKYDLHFEDVLRNKKLKIVQMWILFIVFRTKFA